MSEPRADASFESRLREVALALGTEHAGAGRDDDRPASNRLGEVVDVLDRARAAWTGATPTDPATRKAAEWFLDNEYIVRRALRQVTDEFPAAFRRKLGRVASGPSAGAPPLFLFTLALVRETELEFDLPRLRAFLDAYQERSALSIAELWALPPVLRIVVLEELAGYLHRLLASDASESATASPAVTHLAPELGVERVVRVLRLLHEIDWKTFFERSSRVEAILREDATYARMDFQTCDAYRRVVEDIAFRTDGDEPKIARAAVALAAAHPSDVRRGHVGFYLVAEGRVELEAGAGYVPPLGERVRRAFLRRPAFGYLAALATVTAILLGAATVLIAPHARPTWLALYLVLAFVPASTVATVAVQRLLARLVPPRALPKLDFADGVPDDCRTAVVVPALLTSPAEAVSLVRQLEVHFLSNPDPNLAFVLLTDDADARTEADRADGSVVAVAEAAIDELNRNHGRGGVGPFHLVHRAPRWNAAEDRFMGWERKRGKLEELNRFLRGDTATTIAKHVGDPRSLAKIRFVITLDADTQLPLGAGQRLIGLLAHPLNVAVFADDGRVVAGYTIVQPRVETTPESGRRSAFARWFAGDAVFDIYTHAVSDTYQDIDGAGIFVGKGIYDVDGFMRSVEGKVPDNWIASHDLFEGILGRAALATDVVLYEEYPSSYLTHARRKNRWIRGDWQLLPWLFPRVPVRRGPREPNRLRLLDRWKIVDNLRRSLLAPALLGLLAVTATGVVGHPLVHLAIVLLGTGWIAGAFFDRNGAARWALEIAFLPHETKLAFDAIGRALWRMIVTKKGLLQWTTAAQAARAVGRGGATGVWRETWACTVAAATFLALAIVVGQVETGIALAIPIAAFAAAPWIIVVSARRTEPDPVDALTEADRVRLRLLARRTWLFFETYVGPNDQWLPPDNVQDEPHHEVAHRTSPTNIGLYMLSAISAHDFGFVAAHELTVMLRNTLDTIGRLERYRGHVLNWYDTRTLEPLLPRYVSTVDSGNLAGCYVAIRQACDDLADAPLVRREQVDGLVDVVALLDEAFGRFEARNEAGLRVRGAVERLARSARALDGDMQRLPAGLAELEAGELAAVDRELLAWIEAERGKHDTELLREIHVWIEVLHRTVRDARRHLDVFAPWLALRDDEGAPDASTFADLGLSLTTGPRELARVAEDASTKLAALDDGTPARKAWCARMSNALVASGAAARTLVADLGVIATRARAEQEGMDFRLLFQKERKLFHIGYDVTADRIDANFYDLLASEARLSSYLAVVRKEVPPAHWYALGRPLTSIDGAPTLVSWGGTMFEYLMPALLMRSHAGTLLAESCKHAVDAHIAHGRATGVPWGVSESGFAHLDAHDNYQYRSFGVPGLGLKRGLEEDVVVAPYASMMAVGVRPRAVMENLDRLTGMDALGRHGLYEALDFQRTPEGRPYAVVREHMAHHQGMILVALDNALHDDVHVRRFHGDRLVASGEVMLDERIPGKPAIDEGTAVSKKVPSPPPPAVALHAWQAPNDAGTPSPWVLGNGRLSCLVTDRGSGGLRFRDLQITRWTADATCENEGTFVYVRDDESGALWSTTPVPTRPGAEARTVFHAFKVETLFRHEGIAARTEVVVAPADDVEIRLVTLHNESSRARRLTLTSAAEPVLEPAAAALRHPAFSRMFLESELVPDMGGLLFRRRPRNPDDPQAIVVHRVVADAGTSVRVGAVETDRGKLLGRNRSARNPEGLEKEGSLSGRVGYVLDPVMAISAQVDIAPRGRVTLAFVTAVARSRDAALDLGRRYGTLHTLRWALRDAEPEAARRVAKATIDPALLPMAQRLLAAFAYRDRSLRAPADVLAAGRPCKEKLWGHGISGDEPIVLVRTAPDDDTTIIAQLLGIQRYLRMAGVTFDLLVLDAGPSGYLGDSSNAIRRVLDDADALPWLARRAGVFVLATDQLDAEARLRLESAARVHVDTARGPLVQQLGAHPHRTPPLPRFEATASPAPSVDDAPIAVPKLLHDNGFGGFSEDGRTYVIRVGERSTPMPWSNVIANPTFGCMVSESSLGVTWSLNSGENRLTPWNNDPVTDPPGEAIYVRDEETAAFWSPTPAPVGTGRAALVHHGAGHTTFESERQKIAQKLTVFVPPDAPVKIMLLRLENKAAHRRRLTVTYFAEWVLGTRRDASTTFLKCDHDATRSAVFAENPWNTEFAGRVAFATVDRPLHGFTCDRVEFLGAGGVASPAALARWGLSGNAEPGVDPCAALQTHVELAPGEIVELHFVVGQGKDRDEATATIDAFRSPQRVAEALAATHAYWDELLGATRVDTPDSGVDLLLNRWLLYQTVACRIFGRTAFYQSSGAFGFRDQLQDVLAVIPMAPQIARAHLLESARHQFEQGDVLHWWHPPSSRGVRSRCSDDLLWLTYVTSAYVLATDDVGVLDEVAPYLRAPELRVDEHDRYGHYELGATGTLLEHCERALDRGFTEGAHGLPLMLDGDWNDGMNRVGAERRGESVWLGWFVHATATAFADVKERIGDAEGAALLRSRAAHLASRIEACAWDGDWYLRAFHDDGSKLGSHGSRNCRIDSIAQSWAAISGAGDRDRARLAMRSADEHLALEKERIVLLLTPAFDGTRHDPGYIQAYPPGIRENGGQYTHAGAWLGFGFAAIGDGDGAYKILSLLSPVLHARTEAEARCYRTEPYVLAGDVYGVAPHVGRGGWTWYSGAAAWTYRLGIEAIVGLRRRKGLLAIDPCLPRSWPRVEAWTRVGNDRFHVVIENPDGVSRGVASISVDGHPADAKGIRLSKNGGGVHEVVVRLGATESALPRAQARTSVA